MVLTKIKLADPAVLAVLSVYYDMLSTTPLHMRGQVCSVVSVMASDRSDEYTFNGIVNFVRKEKETNQQRYQYLIFSNRGKETFTHRHTHRHTHAHAHTHTQGGGERERERERERDLAA